ncbi:MAG: hypothetical protein AAF990_27265, partial [Bacteroidota bacterium]
AEESTSLPFAPYSGGSVRFMELSAGSLEFRLVSARTQDVQVRIRIPSLTRDGVVFERTVSIVYSGSTPSEAFMEPISVEGYRLEVVNDEIQLEYTATSNGQVVEIEPIVGQARGWEIANVQGNFEEQQFQVKYDSIEIELFDLWSGGRLTFEEPKLVVTFENSFGFPAAGRIRNLRAITVDNQVINFETDSPDNTFDIAYPSVAEMGSTKTTAITFDKNNSNIDDILNAQPRLLVYELDLTLNPTDQQDVIGFVASESEVVTHVNVELPVYGTASEFEIEERAEFDMGEDTDEIIEGEIKLIAENGIPINLGLQFYFTNQSDQIVDSLFSAQTLVLPAAEVDTDGNVIRTGDATTVIAVSPARMDLLRTYKDIITSAVISTSNTDNRSVRVNANQVLDIKLGARLVVDPE